MRHFVSFAPIAAIALLSALVSSSHGYAQGTSTGAGGGFGGSSGGAGGSSMGGTSVGSAAGGSTGNFLGTTSGFLNSGTGTGTGTSSNNFLNSGTGAGNTGGNVRQGGGSSGASGVTTFPGVNTSNVFNATFSNPMALGLASTASKPRFGSALYNITTSTNLNRGTASITSSNSGSTYPGATSIGVRRAPAYTTSLGFEYTPPSGNVMQVKAQEIISNSTRLPSKGSIQVEMDGETLVLRGSAANDHDRRLAESLLRLTPGVHEVRNELQLTSTARK